MATNYRTNTSQDSITANELQLYQLIMEYRASLGLPSIPLSKSLSIVAGRHALDDIENEGAYDGHSWSDAPYDSANPATYANMWDAPQRVGTQYTGSGFEISTGYTTRITEILMTPQEALDGWKSSPAHNSVMTNAGVWDQPWKAIGIGMYQGVAHVWFGNETDPAGAPVTGPTGPTGPSNGIDVYKFSITAHEASFRHGGDEIFVTTQNGTTTVDITHYERLEFTNLTLAFDLAGNAGKAYRIYEAAFDRTPDISGLGYWIDRLDAGTSLKDVAAGFIGSAEFKSLYGANPSNTAFVEALYRNILDRQGEAGGVNFWVGQLASGQRDKATVLEGFSESAENIAAVQPDIAGGIWFV